MIVWIINGILLILTIYFGIRLHEKLIIDKNKLSEYQSNLDNLKAQKVDLNNDIRAQREIIEENNRKIKLTKDEINEVEAQYNKSMRDRAQELDDYFDNLRQTRQYKLDDEFERKKQDNETTLKLEYDKIVRYYKDLEDKAKVSMEQMEQNKFVAIEEANKSIAAAQQHANEEQEKYNALLEPIRQYEREKQERLFYTIQVPDEYKDDIDFLLTTVSKKVAHPDIINKLIWSEYVKPYIDDTFKRVGIEDKSGIYKLTSLQDGKCYVGKSTNIKKRLSDHFKASVGLTSIAWQAVHDAIAREGYWNWTIEPIIYCDKDRLNEMEKYYISFFKSNEFGYNRTGGGEG